MQFRHLFACKLSRVVLLAAIWFVTALNSSLLAAAALPGDYNNNGTVSLSDFTLWRDCWNSGSGESCGTGGFEEWASHYVIPSSSPFGVPSVNGPQLSVVNLGPNGSGNLVWSVQVTPQASAFADHPPNGIGGSVGMEVGFTVSQTSLVTAATNATNFPSNHPGDSPFPFGNAPTRGLTVSGNQAFAALGSTYFTTGLPYEALRIETLGTGATTVAWSGVYGASGNLGLLAQAGQE